MNIRNTLTAGAVALAFLAGSAGGPSRQAASAARPVAKMPTGIDTMSRDLNAASRPPCDPGLWQHVYHGRFDTAGDRLKVIRPCITVTGTIATARAEKDGDYHIRLAVDSDFRSLLNAKNNARLPRGQSGCLVVEPMCEAEWTQPDVINEGVCNNFSQRVFTLSMIGDHVSVTGAYVTDMQHGWNEIHPVSRIRVIP
jgi:hypothetical protein